MYNLFFQYFIFLNMIFFALIPFLFSDLFMIWFFMEINNFLFICFMNLFLKNKKMIFFYFIIQMFASLMLIFSLSIKIMLFENNYIYMLFMMALIMKLGIPPFHYWMPIMNLHCNWNIIFLMLTIQKLIPFYLISLMKINFFMLYFLILMCTLIPPLIMINVLNFKKLIVYSSINQSGWLIFLSYFKNFIWMIYFTFYMISLLLMIILINKFNMNFNSFNKKFLNYNYLNFFIMFFILNMASMPPFSMFFIKWFSMMLFIFNSMNFFIIFIIILLGSFMMFYIYLNMMFMSMFFNLIMMKNFFFNTWKFKFFHMIKISFLFMSLFLSFFMLFI